MGVLIERDSTMAAGRSPTVDMSKPGQNGALRNPLTWLYSQRFVRTNTIAFLVAGPDALSYFPDGEYRLAVLRSLIEDRAKTIQGLNNMVSFEFADSPEGHSGAKVFSPSRAAYNLESVTYEWDELKGRGIHYFFHEFGLDLIMDPETQRPRVYATEAWQASGNVEMLASDRSFAVLFVEPNEAGTDVVSAVLGVGMMPKTTGNGEFTKEIGGSKDTPVVSIEFTMTPDFRRAVFDLARERLEDLNKGGYLPDSLSSYHSEISANVAAATESGYAATLNGVGAD